MSPTELDVSLEGLRTFVALAEQGSILGAATQLRTSRATVRRHLEQLEEVLGFPLLLRRREGIELTREGHDFLKEAKKLIGQARQAVVQARENNVKLASTVRVGVQVGYPMPIAMMLDEKTHERFSNGIVEMLVSERPVELLPDKADIVMCLGEQRPPVPCVAYELLTLRQRILGSMSYVEKHGPFVRVQDAVAHVIGAWRGPDGTHSRLHLATGEEVRLTPRTITSDEAYLRALASLGHGLVYAPLPLKDGLDPAEPLVAVLDEQAGREVPLTMYALEAVANVPRVRFVVDLCRSALESLGSE